MTDVKKYPLYSSAEVQAWPAYEWLIPGVLPKIGTGAIFGESRIGKSFLTLDLATKLALGEPWFGYPTTPSRVVYFPAESWQGLRPRVEAIEAHIGHALPSNLQFMKESIEFSKGKHVDTLLATLKDSVDVIFIDTFNAVTPNVDENSGKDMGPVLAGLRKIVDTCNCLVIFVHHCGHTETARMRGHSSLPAALDVRIQVSVKNGLPAWKVKGQREGSDTGEHIYRLSPVELPNSSTGSCIVVPKETLPPPARTPSGKNQKEVLDLIKKLQGVPGPVTESLLMDSIGGILGDAANMGRQRVKEAVQSLMKNDFLTQDETGNYILT